MQSYLAGCLLYGRRMENYRFPKAQTARDELGATIGRDGLALLAAVDAAAELPELDVLRKRQDWTGHYHDP